MFLPSLCLVFAPLFSAALSISRAPVQDPIVTVDAEANADVFAESGRSKPLVLRSKEDAAKYFEEKQLGKLTEQVDFSRQIVLVFAWRGSGQDKLEYAVMESYPEQIAFSYSPGRTRDLRPHVKIFALRANVKWSVKGGKDNSEARGAAQYLNEKGELRSALTFKDAQWGFAGESGYMWTVEPNGEWRRQPFLNEDARDADGKGKLSKEQLAQLAEVLAKAECVKLPKSTGETAVNPHIITLTFGEKTMALVLDPGQPLPEEDKEQAHTVEQRFASIARWLQAKLAEE